MQIWLYSSGRRYVDQLQSCRPEILYPNLSTTPSQNRNPEKYTGNGVADLPQHDPPHLCYHTEFGRSVLKGVGIYRRTPNMAEPWNSVLLGSEASLTPMIHASPRVCRHVKFGSFATKGVRINRREPPKLDSASAPPH